MAESQKGVGTDAITAIIAAILALANALDKKGALSFEEYRDALLGMYREMPHEDASGDAGHILCRRGRRMRADCGASGRSYSAGSESAFGAKAEMPAPGRKRRE